MTESPLESVGLFDPARQRRLLDGLISRKERATRELQQLRERLNTEETREIEQLDLRRHETLGQCREQRREMLQRWEDAEEQITATYEAETVGTRKKIGELAGRYRRRLAEGKAGIQRKVTARREAVLQQYENRRNLPSQQMRKENAQIDEALGPLHADIERARELAIRRLDGLPEVGPPATPEESVSEPNPTSVRETIDTLGRLARHAKAANEELQSGAASKAVDSFYLPAGVAGFIAVWSLLVLLIRPAQMLLWLIASVPVAGLIGFIVYGVLLRPLRKMTRRIYPRCERIHTEALRIAEAGRRIAKKQADETSAELIERRDAHLAAAERWQAEQTAELEQRLSDEHAAAKKKLEQDLHRIAENFTTQFNRIGEQMRGDADSLAESINRTLSVTDAENRLRREVLVRNREEALKRGEVRLSAAVLRGIRRIRQSRELVNERFLNWPLVASGPLSRTETLPCLPVGLLSIDGPLEQAVDPQLLREVDGAADAVALAQPPPSEMPIVLHRRRHAGLVIDALPQHFDQAVEVVQTILWRALVSVAPGRVKLTLIDPVGRGRHFAGLMALADHDAELIGHRVWTGERQIDQRLTELAHHVEDILQVTLRDRFERIEQYNEIAGSLAEPYRLIAAVGVHEGFNADAYKALRAVIDNSLRVGMWTLAVCDRSRPLPDGCPLTDGRRLLRIGIDDDGRWVCREAGFEALPFVPVEPPPPAIRSELVTRVGAASKQAAHVEVSFLELIGHGNAAAGINGRNGNSESVSLPPGERDSASGLEIPAGVQGAGRIHSLRLGEGVRQHVLIAGKTGSGKSSLLHTIITAGATYYRPDQLHFYLLDFKKGVEFKVYADTNLPHARVIGIESEREFGRSVLQRLDADLQQRGEQFRAAGAQELAEYRRRVDRAVPRILLVIDEFQELFVRDDALAAECAMLLDRLVRQGRSFGMHIILSSQSLAGGYSLPRATLGQMAVRVALQCSEADAGLILADDNPAAKFISRPGEAIYNDAGGLLEGNQPFQAAYLGPQLHRDWLAKIAARDAALTSELAPRTVFEGNRPCRWSPELAEAAVFDESPPDSAAEAASDDEAGRGVIRGLLGEAVEIGPPMSVQLDREPGRNLLIVAPPESVQGLLAAVVSGAVASARTAGGAPEIYCFDGHPNRRTSAAAWMTDAGLDVRTVNPRESESLMVELAEEVRRRSDDDARDAAPVIVIVDPLNRFGDLRHEDAFNFSLDAASPGGAEALQTVLRDGPAAGVFSLLCCAAAETVARWLPRQSRHDLQLRILGRVNASDSAALIDTTDAAALSTATMLLYDDADGSIRKFRSCALPPAEAVREWLAELPVRR